MVDESVRLNPREIEIIHKIIHDTAVSIVDELRRTESNKKPHHDPADLIRLHHEAARRLGVSVSWLYKKWRDLPFIVKINNTVLRVSQKGLETWVKQQQKAGTRRW